MSTRKRLATMLNEKFVNLKKKVDEQVSAGHFDEALVSLDSYSVFFDAVGATVEAFGASDDDARPVQTIFNLLDAERSSIEQQKLLSEDLA